MSSEIIVHTTYNAVLKFLESMMESSKFTKVAQQINTFFPTWHHAWNVISSWLKEHSLTNMQTSIHSFAQLFPNYPIFANELNNSLVMHDEFWNQVHKQLVVAKRKLKND